MSPSKITCPECGRTDTCHKVSHIYIESISQKTVQDAHLIPSVLGWPEGKPANSLRTPAETRFLHLFTPPAGQKEPVKAIHPDTIMIALGLVSIFFIYQIATQQPALIWVSVAVLAVLLGSYAIFRKSVIGRFMKNQEEKAEQNRRTKEAIAHWTHMYYCINDQIAFDPKLKKPVKIEDLTEYLVQG